MAEGVSSQPSIFIGAMKLASFPLELAKPQTTSLSMKPGEYRE